MKKSAVAAMAAIVLTTVMLVGSFVTVISTSGPELQPPAPRPYVSGSSPKTVVFEFGTGTWCPPCAKADPAIGRIADEYPADKLVVLAWHGWSTDPWKSTLTEGRLSWYGINAVPTAVVDGGRLASQWQIGAWADIGTNYGVYRPMIDAEYASGSNVAITVTGDLSVNSVTVNATITATDPVPTTTYPNLNVRFVLYEDSVYYMGTNGEPFHRGVVLDMKEHPNFLINQSETKYVTDSFALRPESTIYLRNNMGVAVLLQSDAHQYIDLGAPYFGYSSEILNAAKIDFVQPGIVTYREETAADYTEPYEKLLSSSRIPFRTWDNLTAGTGDTGTVDTRGPPTAAELAPYSMIGWFTSSQTAGILTPYDQTMLQNQLGAGPAQLLVSGENIGAAIGTTPFYSNVLQASFVNDNAGTPNTLRGVAGDPVSGTWATGALAIAGTSPDVVNAAGTGTLTFQYNTGGGGAAVRSDFDADSRVIYMAQRYFDGTDANRQAVLLSMIHWFDAKTPPAVTVGWPNGGEVLFSLTPYKLTWVARDVMTPVDAVDIFYTADSVSPTWVQIAAGEPNDGVYWWTPPFGIDSNKCRIKVVVRDSTGQTGEDISNADFTIGIPPHDTYNLTLRPGLNLVSIPFDSFTPSIAQLFATIDPNYDWIRVYDATKPSDPWVTWYRGGPPNELARITRIMGFWIHITSPTPVNVTIEGTKSTSTSIPLLAGWNLVGFPSTRIDITAGSLKTALGASTIVTGPDLASPYGTRMLADTDALATGSGYWIYVQSARTWTVPYA